jgi:hypothetical protein
LSDCGLKFGTLIHIANAGLEHYSRFAAQFSAVAKVMSLSGQQQSLLKQVTE